MKSKQKYIFSGFLLLASTLVRAENYTEIKTSTLTCGDAVLTSKTTYYNHPDFSRQVLDQQITLTNPRSGKQKQIKTDGKYVIKHLPEKRKVLDSAIDLWTCIKSSKGKKYFLLGYYCTSDEEIGFCAQGKVEWFRYLKEDGTLIDKSPRHWHVTRKDEILFKSLGINDNKPIQMKGINEK